MLIVSKLISKISKRFAALAAAVFIGVCFYIPSNSNAMSEQETKRIEEALEAHGVSTAVPSLVAFLSKGWEGSRAPAKLPEVPITKSTLLIDTWQYLALHYKEVQANPIQSFHLSDLARKYAMGEYPPAIQQMIQKDVESAEPALRQAKQTDIKEFLQYNGMVALGLFGKPSSDLIRDVRAIYMAESRPIIQVAYAKTLALLGDKSVLDDLVKETAKANSGSSVAAAQALSFLLNQSFGITPYTAAEPRKEKAAELQRWWEENRNKVSINREAVIGQMLSPPVARPYPQRTVRDLLHASADKNDVKDQLGSRTAWTRLKDMAEADAKALLKELEPIVKDEREDLDVRDQAIRWYVELRGEKARGTLKKLQKDPNPEVAELAGKYLAK